MAWSVSVYIVDQAYGGSEEGGWWYLCGTRDTKANYYHFRRRSAEVHARVINKRLDKTLNEGRREISSVLSTGRYVARVSRRKPPRYFPKYRPHYE